MLLISVILAAMIVGMWRGRDHAVSRVPQHVSGGTDCRTECPECPAAVETGGATLAIEHFSIIEGTTWSGAHDRAGKRIAEKYPNVEYVYREEVGPDVGGSLRRGADR